MGRQNYRHLVLRCNKGINEQTDLADPDECADALNVWAPNGAVEQRPGFVGFDSMTVAGDSITTQSQEMHKLVSGTYTSATEGQVLTLDDLGVGSHWFIGFEEISNLGTSNDRDQLLGYKGAFVSSRSNSNNTWFKAEYWNGTEYKYLRVSERISTSKVSKHLGDANSFAFSFVAPGDWASSTINGRAAFYLRFTIQDNALDSEVEINNADGTNQIVSPEFDVTRGLFVAQFKTKKRYFYLTNPAAGARAVLGSTLDLEDFSVSGYIARVVEDDLANIAVVPQFDEAFVAYAGVVMRFTSSKDLSTAVDADLAVVEDADFAVGEDAPYDRDFVVLLEEWPKARFNIFYNGRLWCAGMEDEPFTVRWSAAAPYHKVWTSLAFAPIMEDDNSPITGMAALGESVVIFKGDSIWTMVAAGENQATGVDNFIPIRVVAGVGCVSNASIQRVKGALIFLAEDGIYRFDGTPNIIKLSDRIGDTVRSINPSRRHVAASANWKTQGCYLLSVAVDGSFDNNRTIVYDYKNNAFWIWDVAAKFWLADEDAYDNLRLYFINQHSQVFEFGVGNNDHGAAISSNILTQRIGQNSNVKTTVRQVEVLGDNQSSSLSVALRHNDDENSESSGTISMTTASDAVYGTAVSGTDKYVQDRRLARRLSFRKQADFFQVKISHDAKNTPMTIAGVDVGYNPGGRR
tara:strand:- start:8382 stop:10448 length:2067 start_codon:yes stop_codon:yes gene_type:complete